MYVFNRHILSHLILLPGDRGRLVQRVCLPNVSDVEARRRREDHEGLRQEVSAAPCPSFVSHEFYLDHILRLEACARPLAHIGGEIEADADNLIQVLLEGSRGDNGSAVAHSRLVARERGLEDLGKNSFLR